VDSLSAIFYFRRQQDTVGFVSPEAGAPKVEQKCPLKRFQPPNSTRLNSFHKIISRGGLIFISSSKYDNAAAMVACLCFEQWRGAWASDRGCKCQIEIYETKTQNLRPGTAT
jgi:hypothetical protein